MAGGQERILRRRIRSVQSTKKITRAMELIAASRIVKAQARVQAAQPYADGITGVMRDLAAAGAGSNNPMLSGREHVQTVAHIAIAADRGLCGGYNSQIVRTTEREMRAEAAAGHSNVLVTSGRKPENYFRFREVPLEASFTGFSDNPTYEDARAIAASVSQKFLDGEIDRVQIIYTKFVSAGRQQVVIEPLMPLDTSGISGTATPAGEQDAPGGGSYEYEPAPDTILDSLLPRYAEARLFAALLNAAASEHAFRQRAMKAATDNADELIRNLSRVMNRARQDAITTEIMEIVGGAEALSQGPTDDDFLAAR
ncbi:MAG TPA: F0F1 ATP synthase subunit gamma [Acidimicrobiia bacterium]